MAFMACTYCWTQVRGWDFVAKLIVPQMLLLCSPQAVHSHCYKRTSSPRSSAVPLPLYMGLFSRANRVTRCLISTLNASWCSNVLKRRYDAAHQNNCLHSTCLFRQPEPAHKSTRLQSYSAVIICSLLSRHGSSPGGTAAAGSMPGVFADPCCCSAKQLPYPAGSSSGHLLLPVR